MSRTPPRWCPTHRVCYTYRHGCPACLFPPASPPPEAVLSADDIAHLTAWKWQYVLQADGWTKAEAGRLLWTRWRHETGRLVE